MNRYSRKNGGKPSCQHVPEEVSHGVSSFREAAPRWQRIREREERQYSLKSPVPNRAFFIFFKISVHTFRTFRTFRDLHIFPCYV